MTGPHPPISRLDTCTSGDDLLQQATLQRRQPHGRREQGDRHAHARRHRREALPAGLHHGLNRCLLAQTGGRSLGRAMHEWVASLLIEVVSATDGRRCRRAISMLV